MAPKNGKCQGKKNNNKIKSKLNSRKRGLKTMKKGKSAEKPLENLKWLNKGPDDAEINQSEAIPKWLNNSVYKHGRTQMASSDITSEGEDAAVSESLVEEEDDKSTSTDMSDECNCDHPKYSELPKAGILKHKISSTNSVVAKYIKSGMDHVASFIVESAIRFGEEHGVVVPDKTTPNLYEITPPKKSFAEKARKIRFKIPEKMLGYEDAKKVMWRSGGKTEVGNAAKRSHENDEDERNAYESKSSSWSTNTDSLEDILPLLEKLKNAGEIVSSELDIDKLAKSMDVDDRDRKRSRARDKYRKFEKRYKSMDEMSKTTEEQDCDSSNAKPTWKRFKRDSLDLGRQRLRAVTCPRQSVSMSPSPY